ncbi:MAG TPA: hypothetical protein VJ464_29230 [Blastocatellia bacterium]|nr:hypothetical protein [Blastocatellia bacterium]
MKTSEPNNSMPPSPDESGVAGDLLPLTPLRSSWTALLVRPQMGDSPESQKQLMQPQVHSSPRPPGIVCPASAPPERQRIITDIASHFFTFLNIRNSFQDELLAKRMVAMAEVAYSQRCDEELQVLGQLLELTKRYKFIGAYYRGLAALKSGSGDFNHAQWLLEQAAEFAPARYRARAILSLGAVEGYRGDISTRLQHLVRALSIEQADHYTRIEASRSVALIHSLEGDHHRAVEQLESLYPIARHFARVNPRLYFDLLNSLAVEYAECGRIQEAEAAIRPALVSPLAQTIKEYRETAAEIAEQQSSKAIIAVALPPDAPDEAEERPRPLNFSEPLTPARLPLAPPSPIPARLLTCAPIRAPTT